MVERRGRPPDTGQVLGGHVAAGCIVRTTAEILLALLPGWEFSRGHDAATGYDELVIRPVDGATGGSASGQTGGFSLK